MVCVLQYIERIGDAKAITAVFSLIQDQHLAFLVNAFPHQWITLFKKNPSCPSLLSFVATPNIKWKSKPTWIGTPGPRCKIIYRSRYDADSSINKGISVCLLQRSQSSQRYLSVFFSCAGRGDVCAVEKHTCWNSEKIFQSTLQTQTQCQSLRFICIHLKWRGCFVTYVSTIYKPPQQL